MAVSYSLFVLLNDVLFLKLQWVDAEVMCYVIEVCLNSEYRLRSTETSECIGGECVCSDTLTLDVCIWDVIYAVSMEDTTLENDE